MTVVWLRTFCNLTCVRRSLVIQFCVLSLPFTQLNRRACKGLGGLPLEWLERWPADHEIRRSWPARRGSVRVVVGSAFWGQYTRASPSDGNGDPRSRGEGCFFHHDAMDAQVEAKWSADCQASIRNGLDEVLGSARLWENYRMNILFGRWKLWRLFL